MPSVAEKKVDCADRPSSKSLASPTPPSLPVSISPESEKKIRPEATQSHDKIESGAPPPPTYPDLHSLSQNSKMSAPIAPITAVSAPVLSEAQAKRKAEADAKRKAEAQAQAEFNTNHITITLKVSINKSVVAQTMANALKDKPYIGDYAQNPECAPDIFTAFKSIVAGLSEDDRWGLLRLTKPSDGVMALNCAQAMTRHASLIAEAHADSPELEAALKTALAEEAERIAEEAKRKAQEQLEADALAYRKLVAEQEAKKAKRTASAPAPAEGGSVASSERPKAKKRPEGWTDEAWEADVARRERNARNSKASADRKAALGIEEKPLSAEDKARRATMTPEQVKAEIVAKKAETRRIRLEKEATLKAQAEAQGE